MKYLNWITQAGWKGHIIAFLAGAITPLYLAPFNLWLLAPVSIALFYLGLQNISPKQALLRGWCYGVGTYLAGVSWIYVSIHTFGAASVFLAASLTISFCMAVALFFLIPAFIWVKWFRHEQGHLMDCFAFAGLWMIQEWFRGWFLTGFPWLYAGYSQLDGPLAGFAPIGGVWFVSYLIALLAALCTKLYGLKVQKLTHKFYVALTLLILIPALGLLTAQIQWTTPKAEALPVTLIQGNIDQAMKWDPQHFNNQLALYQKLTVNQQQNNGLVIWPENAIPFFQEQLTNYLTDLDRYEKNQGAALITGIPVRKVDAEGQSHFYNGMMVVGEGQGNYFKQKLVPFGEYVPFEALLRDLIGFFDLPMSSFSKGSADQKPLQAKGYQIAPFICYEVVYPDFAASLSSQSDLLLTISNDTWFGRSIGPIQHLQMAQMRALEAGRWMIRATNNGVTAIINPQGTIVKRLPQFEQAILQGTVYPVIGKTPYLLWYSWPILIFSTLCLFINYCLKQKSPTL